MKMILCAIAVIVALFASFLFGTRLGVREFQFADAQYRASLDAFQLEGLSAGKVENIKAQLEIDLDSKLAIYADYTDSHFKWLWPSLQPKDNHAIQHAVRYRITNPYVEPDMSSTQSWKQGVDMQDPFIASVATGQISDQEKRNRVLGMFSK